MCYSFNSKSCIDVYMVACLKDIKPNAVFGVPLHLLAGEDNTCPPVLDKLIAELDNRGVYTAGIYRKSGAAQRVRTLRKALNSGMCVSISSF